jgi:hypothetical protein
LKSLCGLLVSFLEILDFLKNMCRAVFFKKSKIPMNTLFDNTEISACAVPWLHAFIQKLQFLKKSYDFSKNLMTFRKINLTF